MARKKPGKRGGGTTLTRRGVSLIFVTPDAEQKKKIRVAAALAGLPMSHFVLQSGVTAAENILKKNGISA